MGLEMFLSRRPRLLLPPRPRLRLRPSLSRRRASLLHLRKLKSVLSPTILMLLQPLLSKKGSLLAKARRETRARPKAADAEAALHAPASEAGGGASGGNSEDYLELKARVLRAEG